MKPPTLARPATLPPPTISALFYAWQPRWLAELQRRQVAEAVPERAGLIRGLESTCEGRF
jgi:hypothetical protein